MVLEPGKHTDGRGVEPLLLASVLDAWLMFLLLGYGALYAHQQWHASYVEASLVAAAPGFAWFAGAPLMGRWAGRWGHEFVVAIGCVSYTLLGALIWMVPNAWVLALVVGVLSLGTSGLRPAVVGALLAHGPLASSGSRLARRVRWQSAGWLVGGVVGGLLYQASRATYPVMVTVLGAVALVTAIVVWRRRAPDAEPSGPGSDDPHAPPSAPRTVLLLVSYFLAYCAIEGIVTTLGFLLVADRVSAFWVGGNTTIRTAVGWLAAAWYGSWADRWGARRFLLGLLMVFTVLFGVMAVSPGPVVVLGAFAVVLNSPVTLGVQLISTRHMGARGRRVLLGWIQSVSGLGIGLGTVGLGLVANVLGPRTMPAAAAGLMALAVLVGVAATREGRAPLDPSTAGSP